MRNDLPPRVGDLLTALSKRTGIDAPIETARLWSRWKEIVGPDLAAHAEPSSLKEGVLRVRADSSVWATELGYLGEEIRTRANNAVGDAIVKEVRVWTGPGKPSSRPDPGQAQPPPRMPPNPSEPGSEDDPLTTFQRVRQRWESRRTGVPPHPS